MCKKGWTQRGYLRKGGGALKAKGLNRRRKQRRGKSMREGIEPPLIKIFVFENAFQAI